MRYPLKISFMILILPFLMNTFADEIQDVHELINRLNDDDSDIRAKAAVELGRMKDVHAVPSLLRALLDESAYVRWEAAEALGRIGDPTAVVPLVKALKDEDEAVRWEAAEALGELGDHFALEPLIESLKDEDEFVRYTAAKSLGKLKNPLAVDSLIKALQDKDEDVRWYALVSLGEIGDIATIDPIVALLYDEDSDVREEAADVLLEFGWQPKNEKEEIAFYIAQEQWHQCIKKGQAALDQVIPLLKDEYIGVREGAAWTLAYIGDRSAIPFLVDALPDWHSSNIVARALEKMGWIPESIEEEVFFLGAKREKGRLFGLWPYARPLLMDLLESNNIREIHFAANVLILIDEEEIVPELLAILNEKGNETMAAAFDNTNNRTLEHAARQWLAFHDEE